MAKNLILGLILACLTQMWAHKICLVSFTSTSSYTLFQVIILWNFKKKIMNRIEKMAKNLVSGLILAHLAQIRTNNFF